MTEEEVCGKGRKLCKCIEKAYRAGWAEGVRSYAIWSDGEQLVGVMHKPLAAVLKEGPDTNIMAIHLEVKLSND